MLKVVTPEPGWGKFRASKMENNLRILEMLKSPLLSLLQRDLDDYQTSSS